jgi:hypothetical protein
VNRCASCLPVTCLFSSLSGCFYRRSASSSPCVSTRRRTRHMGVGRPPHASVRRSDDHVGPCVLRSVFTPLCACGMVCASVFPLDSVSSRCDRCSSVRSMLFFRQGLVSLLGFQRAESRPPRFLFFT